MSSLPDSNILLVNPTLLRDEITRKNYQQLNLLLADLSSEIIEIPSSLLPNIFIIVQRYIENHPEDYISISDLNSHNIILSTRFRALFIKNFMDRLFDPARIFSPFFYFEFRGMNRYYLQLYELVLRHNLKLFFTKKNYRIKSCQVHEPQISCLCGNKPAKIKIKVVPNMDVKEGKYNKIVINQLNSLDITDTDCFNQWDVRTTYSS